MADAEKVASVRRERDRAIMDAIGSSLRRTVPWVRLRPGDLAQLRLFLAQAQHDTAERNLAAAEATDDFGPALRGLEAAGRGLLLTEAVPFFIPAGIAGALMSSEPPDATLSPSIRLPFPSILVFFDAIPLGEIELDGELIDVITGEPTTTVGSALVGVSLYAGDDGAGIAGAVEWLVTKPIRDVHGVALVPGLWRHSAQPGVVSNLASLCRWARWAPPPPTPAQVEGEEGSRPWRRSLSRSAVRKAITRGAVAGVNVVDLGALRAPSDGSADATPSTRSVRAHWRRGYWNSVRVATRDTDGRIVGYRLGELGVDWHYEGRWIHPVLTRGTASSLVTVYTVPDNG